MLAPSGDLSQFLLSRVLQLVLVDIGPRDSAVDSEDGSNDLSGWVYALLTADSNLKWAKLVSTSESDCDHICETVKNYLQLYPSLKDARFTHVSICSHFYDINIKVIDT